MTKLEELKKEITEDFEIIESGASRENNISKDYALNLLNKYMVIINRNEPSKPRVLRQMRVGDIVITGKGDTETVGEVCSNSFAVVRSGGLRYDSLLWYTFDDATKEGWHLKEEVKEEPKVYYEDRDGNRTDISDKEEVKESNYELYKREFYEKFVDRGTLDAEFEGQILLTQDGVDELWSWIESKLPKEEVKETEVDEDVSEGLTDDEKINLRFMMTLMEKGGYFMESGLKTKLNKLLNKTK